jgi:hypothetical protein
MSRSSPPPPDFDRKLVIHGLHAVRAYRDDASDVSTVVGEVRWTVPEGDRCWLARGECRPAPSSDEAPHRPWTMAQERCARSRSRSATATSVRAHERTAAAALRPTPVLDRQMLNRSTSVSRAACCSNSPPASQGSSSSHRSGSASRWCSSAIRRADGKSWNDGSPCSRTPRRLTIARPGSARPRSRASRSPLSIAARSREIV